MILSEVVHSPLNHRSRSSTASTPSAMEGQDANNNNDRATMASPGPLGLVQSDAVGHAPWGMATQMVHSLFGVEFGPCWGDFFCSHGRIRGRLYAVTNGILFYSNLLGFERRLCLQFANVTSITLHRTTSIRIEIADFEYYIFRSFHDREQVLQLLVRLKRLVDKKRARLNMDRGASAASATHPAPEGADTDYFDQWEKRQNQYESQWRNDEVQLQQSPMATNGLRSSYSATHVNRSTLVGGTLSLSPNRRRAVSDSFVRGTHDPASSSTTPEPLDANTTSHNPFLELTSDSLLELWNATAKKLSALEEVGVEPIRLSCSIDTFYELFLRNEARSSFDHYQREFIRDRDVRITSWMNDSPNELPSDEMSVYSRVLTFTHPIKSTLGMGPSEAKTTRKQILRRYQQYGMTLENCTTVEGIPAADTFSVHDFWRIEADGIDTVTISANFAPRFTKRTIFKNLIEKSVLKETKAWFVGYATMLLQTLEKTKGPMQSATKDSSIDNPSGAELLDKYQRKMLSVLIWLVAFIVLLMTVLVVFVVQFSGVLASMHNEIVTLRSSISQVAFEL